MFRKKIKDQRDYSKQYYDRRTRPLKDHNVGDTVYVKVHPKGSTWTEGHIEAQAEPRSYIVSANGREYRRNKIHIKPAIEEIDPNPPAEPEESGATTVPQVSNELQTSSTSEPRPKRTTKAPIRFGDYEMN